MRCPRIAVVLLGAQLVACIGKIGEPPVQDDAFEGPPRTTTPPPNVTPEPRCTGDSAKLEPQLRRLTAKQYRNTLTAAFGSIDGVALPDFEDDNPTIGLANDPSKLEITTVSIDSLYASTQALAEHVIATGPIAACIEDTEDTCFGEVIDTYGKKLWRRPVSAEERTDLLEGVAAVAMETATRAEQMSFVIQALVMSPNTLFRVELGAGPNPTKQLTDHELASLLAYTLWDEPPDDALMAAADQGTLSEPTTFEAQTRRMIADDRFTRALAAFYWDYLNLENILTVPKAEELGLTPEARAALATSAEQTLLEMLSAPDAAVMSVFGGQTFAVDATSAPFFGMDPAGLTATPTPVQVNAAEREGILTHPAFLAVHAGQGNTGIVKRGVFTLEQLLGYDLPDPPDDITSVDPAELPPFDPDQTSTREIFRMTHSAQARCMFCHDIIDPAGYGYENYDPVGRFRLTEKQDVPIDASGVLEVNGETLRFADGPEYMRALASSTSMREKVLASYFEYALGQRGDGCEIEAFRAKVGEANDDVRVMAETLVNTDSFAVREEEQ